MDYEKLYKEALERARTIVENQNASSVWKDWLCNTFPELKSEDERIREELITFVKGSIQDEESEQRKAYLDWLEKQEQKPAWSEEDEAHINSIIDYLLDYKLLVYEEDMNVANGAQKELNWLNSLKE